MGLSARDRKILWSRSGNVCTFPGCDQELVQPGSVHGDDVVVGEEAHIVARARAGPRGTSDQDIDLDSCVNFILMCPAHHRVVDAQPDVYSVKVLRAMKLQHEGLIRERLRSQAQVASVVAAGYASLCGGFRTTGAWRVGPSLVLACSYGSEPTLSVGGHWVGSGLEFHHKHDQGSEVMFGSSEAEPDIEYWVDGSALSIVQSTYDPRSNNLAPFVEHTFILGCLPALHSVRLLLSELPASDRDLSRTVQVLKGLPRNRAADAELLLYPIRNVGLSDPDSALSAINGLHNEWWFDGANAEAAKSISRELEILKQFKQEAV
jgi:hypothetical protein